MRNTDYESFEGRLRGILGRYGEKLSAEACQNIEHYMGVAEIEMACESLTLSLLNEEIPIAPESKDELLQLCTALGLAKESIFRANFWQLAQSLQTVHEQSCHVEQHKAIIPEDLTPPFKL